MKNTNSERTEKKMNFLLGIAIFALFVWTILLINPSSYGQTYNETATLNTTVNITNSNPLVRLVTIENPVTLTAYSNKTVYCNTTIFDYDNDTISVNASLFYETSSPLAANDQNDHYTNTSCTQTGRFNEQMNYTCAFSVNYFANNGTWYCNVTAIDDDDAIGTNQSQGGIIEPLIAIRVPGILDFGNLVQGQISENALANITNAGNRDTNLSVEGYAVTPGDLLAMNCSFGEIPLSFERYNATNSSNYDLMAQLSNDTTMIKDIFVPQRVDESLESINSTYWKLQIPPAAGGVCNGKILFTATDRFG